MNYPASEETYDSEATDGRPDHPDRHKHDDHRKRRDRNDIPDFYDCLSLCEVMDSSPVEQVERVWGSRALPLKRIYIGSNFCAQSFLHVSPDAVSTLAKWCAEHAVALTLVVPIFTERNLERGYRHIDRLIDACAPAELDEITVNDFGAFESFGRRIADGLELKLNLGRLFSRDTRDPRVNGLHDHIHTPQLIRIADDTWSFLDRLLATWPINCLEFDPTHSRIDLRLLPESVQAALYGPLCYQSTGQICEYASTTLPIEQRFRPNQPCARQCGKTAISYLGPSNVRFYKLGRTVYSEAAECTVLASKPVRRIFDPIKEVLY